MPEHPIVRDLRNDVISLRASCRHESGTRRTSSSGSLVSATSSGSSSLVTSRRAGKSSPSSDSSPCLRVTDANPKLSLFCKTLEASFRHGLLDPTRHDYFGVFVAMATCKGTRPEEGLHALIKHVVAEIGKVRCLQTSQGKGRYFLRCCLNNGWMSSLVGSLRKWKFSHNWYQGDSLLLRSPNESVMEVLPDLDLLHFDLHLANRSFLDSSWDLPVYHKLELVPCHDLGLMICNVRGRIIVTKVKALSVAGEDGKVGVGDVLDEIDAIPTFGRRPEDVADIVKNCGAKRPITLGVVKARSKSGNHVYAPMVSLIREAGIDIRTLEDIWSKQNKGKSQPGIVGVDGKRRPPPSIILDHTPSEDGEDAEFDPLLEEDEDDEEGLLRAALSTSRNGGNELLYIGSLKVGKVGDATLLDRAIHRVSHDQKKVHHSVTLHLQELGVKMFCNETGNLVLHYTYPEISACGCSSTDNHYLAFIAGNDLCAFASDFLCHVFYCASQNKARTLIANLAEGFERTKNTV